MEAAELRQRGHAQAGEPPNMPSWAKMPPHDASRDDRMDDEDHDVVPEPMGAFDYFLIVSMVIMCGLFFFILKKVAVAILVGILCVGTGAYAYVTAQTTTGVARLAAYFMCLASLLAFFVWSFKYVFYLPKIKTTIGCGGVFFGDMETDLTKVTPRDEL
mmetsp:Transcript_17800/g.55634  ORF Transcript_17800/g.55634 Transcript_17800/m.55634 type:complete len:159 (-) Transcript_17800:907-1383(-)